MNRLRPNHHTVEEVFQDFKGRHTAIVKALTTDFGIFYILCDPDKDKLCLFGYPDERWDVRFPDEEISYEHPEPVLGINLCRDTMREKDWLDLVAAHSDAWLLTLAFNLAIRFGFDSADRNRLFTMINELPTISESVTLTTRRISTGNNKESKSGLKGQGSALGESSKKANDEVEEEAEDEDEDEDEDDDDDEDADYDEGLDEESEDGDNFCGVCGETYAATEFWICCETCDQWFHGKCVKVTPFQADHMQYKCPSCTRKRGFHNSS